LAAVAGGFAPDPCSPVAKVGLFVLNDIIVCSYRYRTMQCRSDSGGQEESFNLWILVGEFAGVVVASYQYRGVESLV